MLLGFGLRAANASKTELRLNNKQRTLTAQHAGVARRAYN
ncbi:helix-turn-helix domain-containing protein [Synechococcus sp. F70.1]